MTSSTAIRVGIDVGGTFTDAVLIDAEGSLRVGKVRSTPQRPGDGFIDSLDRLLPQEERAGTDIEYLAHGTTVATNAIVQRRLGSTAMLTNDGFKDILAIGTQQRDRLYDLWSPQPEPVVPRERCFGIRGRIGPDGEELEPLDEDGVRAAARQLREVGVEAVAVVYLFSFFNPAHEQRSAEILAEELPWVEISLSSDVAPEFREYLRASTTSLNASLLPLVGRYLGDVQSRVADGGIESTLNLMQSNGGVATANVAKRMPVGLVASGPAAGVIGPARLADRLGEANVLTFDMGGTTADVAIVVDGLPELRFVGKPGGFPVNLPQIDVLSIGAGGGSIARVDRFQSLQVGPESAGASPGPCCYRGGGEEPTVTDAHVVIGTLGADRVLGGVVELDPELARKAVLERVAKPLGLTCEEAAAAIIRIANANMTNALRVVSLARGHDPRRFALVAIGGAGPLHACAVADELGARRVIVPPYPGVTAALGLLLTDVRHDLRRTWISLTAAADTAALDAALGALEKEAMDLLGHSGHQGGSARIVTELDMRYRGQAYNLTVELDPRPVTGESLQRAELAFHDAHHRAYGYDLREVETEIITLRARAEGGIGKIDLRPSRAGTGSERSLGVRQVWREGETVDYALVDRLGLTADDRIEECSVVEQEDSTLVVPEGWSGTVTEDWQIVLDRGAA